MKKIMMILIGSMIGIAVNAQEVVVYGGQTSGSYNAYKVPEPILVNFQTTYPASSVATTWQPMNGWWRATYKDENSNVVHVYYSMEPYYLVPVPGRITGTMVSLPVTNTYVPANVKIAAVNRYGANLYSITKMMATDNTEIYQLGLLENGTLRYVWLNANSNAFTDIYPGYDELTAKAGDK